MGGLRLLAWSLALSAPVAFANQPKHECRFPILKSEPKGEERVFSRCRSENDCEVFASFKKSDVDSYKDLIAQKNRLFTTTFLMSYFTGLGASVNLPRVAAGGGRILVKFPVEALKNLFKRDLSKSPPLAGLLKEHIAREFGPKASSEFVRATYVGVTGTPALSAPGVRDGVTFILNPAHEDLNPHLVRGGSRSIHGEICQDDTVKEIEDIKKRAESHADLMARQAACDALPPGGEVASCREDLERYRRDQRLAPSRERIDRILGRTPPSPNLKPKEEQPKIRVPAAPPPVVISDDDATVAR